MNVNIDQSPAPTPSGELDKFFSVLERIDKVRSMVWGIVVGIFLLGVGWANNTNQLAYLARENDSRKAEIRDIQVDRAEVLKEARGWRESTTKEIAKIGATLDELKERLPR